MTAPDVDGKRQRIDAHLHLWELAPGRYGWLTPAHGELYDSFTPEEALAALTEAGMDAAILVQAEDSEADTTRMLNVATANPWVAGVVGWIPLDDIDRARDSLDRRSGDPHLVGVRHLVHDDPRADFFELPAVRASLREVARRGLALDVPDAWPRHLHATARLASGLPELRVIVDHLGKPPVADADAMREWERVLRAIAALPNTAAKLSGLRLPGAAYGIATVRPLVDIALDAFGPDRVLLGSDWPVSGPQSYRETIAVLDECIAELTAPEQDAVRGEAARRWYRIDS